MRKFLVTTAALAGIIAATAVIGTAAKAHGPEGYGGGYGPGVMGGYGPGSGMMGGGYGPGSGMMGSYGPGYMMGPGYGYGPRGYGQSYRGQRLCWHETDSDRGTGYYAPCR